MSDRIKVYVCANHETLRDGILDEPEAYSDEINTAISEVGRQLDDAGYDYQRAQHFQDWHGGKFYQAGNVLGGKRYGYRCGNVATLVVDPPEELRRAIDAADQALDERLAAIAKLAEDVIEVDE